MPFSFQPACLPIAQSGLPYEHGSQAVSFLRHAMPVLLTWPFLPQRGVRDTMYLQSALGFPGLVIDDTTGQACVERPVAESNLDTLGLAYLKGNKQFGALNWDDATGLSEMLRSPAQLAGCEAIMSQILGPISMGLQLTDDQSRPLVYDLALREALGQHLALRVSWLTMRLSHLVTNVIVCLDEPLLTAINSPFCPIDWHDGTELLEQIFASTQGCRGLILSDFGARQRDHDLGKGWSPLLETSVELIGINVYHHSSVLLAGASLLQAFLERPGILMWGLIPNHQDDLRRASADALVKRFEQVVKQLVAAKVPKSLILESSLISTTGSLAYLSAPEAEFALRLCAEVSRRLRAMYGLTEDNEL